MTKTLDPYWYVNNMEVHTDTAPHIYANGLQQVKLTLGIKALDGRGKPWSSEQLAERMEHWRGQGRDLAFLIGGPEGHAPDVVAAAHEKWSLSPLTLPHMLVRLVVAEQVYRAAAMLANHPYHRA